jgi:hypothetical protein
MWFKYGARNGGKYQCFRCVKEGSMGEMAWQEVLFILNGLGKIVE